MSRTVENGYTATPVEVWAPAFSWLEKLTPEKTITSFGLCKLCELEVRPGAQTAHVKQHVAERAAWKRDRDRALRAEQKRRLLTIHRERKLTKKVARV